MNKYKIVYEDRSGKQHDHASYRFDVRREAEEFARKRERYYNSEYKFYVVPVGVDTQRW